MRLPLPLALALATPALAAATSNLTSSSTSTSTPTMPDDAIAAAQMFSEADVAEVRHVVQRILVPCVFVIGLLGNSVSIYVLTRKRMRCTTNIYLTALAITDIAYLTFVLILSFKHYKYVKYHCEIYWKLFGLAVWLCDVAAYISIYIAVCFTIERFIAIRYPLKRQTFCTESLAKKVIAAVVLFCLLTTVSEVFEHTYDITSKLIDANDRPCNQTLANASPTPVLPTPATAWQTDPRTIPSSFMRHIELGSDSGSGSGDGDSDHIPSRLRPSPASTAAFLGVTAPATEPTTAATASILHLSRARRSEEDNGNNITEYSFNVEYFCQNTTFYMDMPSQLAKNTLYMNIWSVYTLVVFVLLPLSLLATFNCFLILLVHRSKSVRGDLTNANSIRRTKRKSNSGLAGSVSQENRVTITLIAVVLLFIVCQLPWAILLILGRYISIQENVETIAGNVCNQLVGINAAANFFLYCVLSDKYRKTVRELVTGARYRHRHARNNMSLYVPHTTTTLNGDGSSSGYSGYNSVPNSRRSRIKNSAEGRLIS